MENKCLECGAVIPPRFHHGNGNVRTCYPDTGRTCRADRARRKNYERHAEWRARRPRSKNTCLECGETIPPRAGPGTGHVRTCYPDTGRSCRKRRLLRQKKISQAEYYQRTLNTQSPKPKRGKMYLEELYQTMELALTRWPIENIDSKKRKPVAEGRCCIFTRIGMILGIDPKDWREEEYYQHGAGAWAGLLGGNRLHAILLLRQAGAGHDPVSDSQGWIDYLPGPYQVLKRIAEIDNLPELRGQDFSKCNLSFLELQGEDLRDCDFTRAYWYGARIKNCNLEGCKLDDNRILAEEWTTT